VTAARKVKARAPALTPGPWRAEPRGDGWHIFAAKPWTFIGVINGMRGDNAQLVAASPDLLELLKEAENLAALGDIQEEEEALGWGSWLARTRAAIAKATGRHRDRCTLTRPMADQEVARLRG
jgi:hypothetical protein